MSGSEVVRHAGGVPPALAQLGVGIQTDEATGYRAVIFPAELRDKVNVLLPVQEVAASDPNFSPSIRMVQLDTTNIDAPAGQVGSPHVYKQGNNRYAPTKQGLEVLATCAGILSSSTGRVPKGELDEGEIGYWAEVRIRRSDGSIDRIRREKIVSWDVEKFKISEQVAGLASKYPSDWNEQRVQAETKKRQLAERENLHAKCESKAVLRAIRAALQIPHVFTKDQLAKPFLVVGYSLTPDWNDPETKRLLLQHGLGAAADVYGAPAALPPGEVDSEPAPEREGHVLPPAPDEPDPRSPDPEDDPPAAAAAADPAASPATAEAQAGQSYDDDPGPEPEPPPPAEPEPAPVPDALRAGAGLVTVTFGRNSGKTISEIFEEDANYVRWLAEKANSPEVRKAATTFLGDG